MNEFMMNGRRNQGINETLSGWLCVEEWMVIILDSFYKLCCNCVINYLNDDFCVFDVILHNHDEFNKLKF